MKVFVIGDYRQTISIVRSLGRAGHEVVILSELGTEAPAGRSKHVRLPVEQPQHKLIASAEASTPSLITTLAHLLSQEEMGSAAVFPVGESEITSVIRSRERLQRAGAIVVAAPETAAMACLDKDAAHRIAEQLAIPMPRSLSGFDSKAWLEFGESAGFRCVIKPTLSGRAIAGRKALITSSMEDLREAIALTALEPEAPSCVIQEQIKGDRHNFQFAAVEGKIIAQFQQHVIRTDVHNGTGYCVDGVSVPVDPLVRDLTSKLVASLNYTGVGCAQFLIAKKDRRPFFLEINPRLDANCELAVSCGIDFPRLALECALPTGDDRNQSLASCSGDSREYSSHRRLAWTTGDFFGLLHAINRKEISARQALVWLFKIGLTAIRASRHATWSWDDPAPAILTVRTRLRNASRGVARRVSSRLSPAP